VIPTVGAEFVCRMEDVLDLYAEPHDPARPVVCFDETSKQLIAETRVPLPMEPGKPERVDYEYERNGTANLFLVTQPLGAWRHVDVTDRRTKHDFARQMRDLVDRHFPAATTIRVVLDNLNTHTPAALYEAFPPAEARRILRKLDFHYTPVHGSWLNMAELEFSMLARQCLGRRIGDRDTLATEIAAWEAARNEQRATISWQFTVDDARRKLHRLYPS
jgi:DDE superfamily endonuclease